MSETDLFTQPPPDLTATADLKDLSGEHSPDFLAGYAAAMLSIREYLHENYMVFSTPEAAKHSTRRLIDVVYGEGFSEGFADCAENYEPENDD